VVSLTPAERHALGLEAAWLKEVGGHLLLPPAGRAFRRLADDARAAGFDLRIASAHRSFERQLHIWNAKLAGRRPVLDDADRPVDLRRLPARDQIECVLRFSALPGASRHHWGTDMDVFDAAAVPADYRLRLDGAEVADDGVFGPLHRWLDERIAGGDSHGFFRPYDRDRGGVAPERWHLSFAPLAQRFSSLVSCELLRRAWDGQFTTDGKAQGPAATASVTLMHRDQLETCLETLVERFVRRVAEPPQAALGYGPDGEG
jgi:LAS superfamily LD-carboxypeptidase LdcB